MIDFAPIVEEAKQQWSNHAPGIARLAGTGLIYTCKVVLNPLLRLVFPECRIDQRNYAPAQDFPRIARAVNRASKLAARFKSFNPTTRSG